MKTKIAINILIIIFLLITGNTNAQWATFTSEVETGIIKGGNRTDKFCEDALGNLWIGTRKGSLIKYNSGKFEIFDAERVSIAAQTTVGDIANAKTGSFVNWLFEKDKINNWVWFASNKSILLWDGKNILEMTGNVDQEDRMIFYSDEEESNYIIQENSTVKLTDKEIVKPTKPIIQTSSILVDSKSRLWVGNWTGSIFCIDKGKWKVMDVSLDKDIPKMRKFHPNQINSIYEDKDGLFWILANSFIAKYDGNKMQVVKSVEYANSVYQDGKNNLWFGYIGGVAKFSNGEWKDFKEKTDFKFAITEGGKFIETKNGDLWFQAQPSTYNFKNGGLYRYSPNGWEFLNVNNKNKVTDLYEDTKGNLWCTTMDAVFRFQNNEWKIQKESDSVLSAAYFSIFEDSKGSIWFGMGSFTGRVERYTP